jgi:hypothetical protein
MKRILSLILLIISLSAFSQSDPISLPDLYQPPPVQFSFETPGWYIAGGLVVIAAIIMLILQLRKYVKNRYRRHALRELAKLENASEIFPKLFVVLKKAAMHAYGRDRVGQLYGKEWLSFLENTGREINLTGYQAQISDALYTGKGIESETRKLILSSATKWVKTHAG